MISMENPIVVTEKRSDDRSEQRFEIQLLGHCILCLRKVTKLTVPVIDDKDDDLVLPEADIPPDFLDTFHKIWPLIHPPSDYGGDDEDICILNAVTNGCSSSLTSSSSPLVTQERVKTSPTYSRVPTMCLVCGDKVLRIASLLNTAEAELEGIREEIEEPEPHEQFPSIEMKTETADRKDLQEEMEVDRDVKMETISDDEEESEEQASSEEEDDEMWEPEIWQEAELLHNHISEQDPLGDQNESRCTRFGRKPAKKVQTTTKKAPPSSSSSSPRPYKCEMSGCGKTYTQAQNLSRHRKLEHPEVSGENKVRWHVCDMCGAQVSSTKLLKHVQEHVGDYALRCPYLPSCKFVASNPNSLRIHMRNTRTCGRVSGKINRDRCVCETCGFRADNILTLRVHIRKAHEEFQVNSLPSAKECECPVAGCDAKFSVRQSVWFHLETHSVGMISVEKCDHCAQQLSVQDMEAHLKGSHEVQEIIRCEQCPYVCASRVSLVKHLYHHRFTGVSCDMCQDGVKYTSYSTLRRHYRSDHQIEVKVPTCELCHAEFMKPSGLRLHMKTRHGPGSTPVIPRKRPKEKKTAHPVDVNGAELLTCETCGKRTKTKQAMTLHKKIHEREPTQDSKAGEWRCDVEGCGKVYRQTVKLREHKARVHEGQPKPVCELCGMSFYDGSALKRHREGVHFRLERFMCEICGKGFSERRKLDRHMPWHHGKKVKFPRDRKEKIYVGNNNSI